MLVSAIIPVALVLLLPVLVAGFTSFDALVKLEHSTYRALWNADRRPRGIFWKPGTGLLGGALARDRLFFKWIFVTPSWAAEDEHARRALRRLRLCVFVWNVGNLIAIAAYLRLAS